MAAIAQATTKVIQEARASVTVGIFAQMPDAATAPPTGGSAEAALAFLTEMSPDLRGAAILDGDGAVLAAEGEAEAWGEAARALLAAADGADPEPAEQVHVATEGGEVFALRAEGLVAVAVTERFALASLMLFDMRQALRDLAIARRNEA
jgi:predicted regulator of Ras-like GTPase activity (Roadblock/LC7/MglB family)